MRYMDIVKKWHRKGRTKVVWVEWNGLLVYGRTELDWEGDPNIPNGVRSFTSIDEYAAYASVGHLYYDVTDFLNEDAIEKIINELIEKS